MRPLVTIDEFREALANRSLVLVRDSAYGDRVHRLPCTFVTAHNFQMKMVVKTGRTGGFFEISPEEVGESRRCTKCVGI